MNRIRLCVVVATSAEGRIVREAMPSVPIIQVGIGAPNISQASIPDCDLILITGFAGALDSRLKIGDIVVYNKCANLNGDSFDCEPIPGPTEWARVNGLTVPQVVVRAAGKKALRNQHQADVVDMETFQLLNVCRQAGVKAAVLRVISDDAADDLPDFNLAIQPDGTLDRTQLSRVLLARPITTLKFVRSFRTSNSSLRSALKSLIELQDVSMQPQAKA